MRPPSIPNSSNAQQIAEAQFDTHAPLVERLDLRDVMDLKLSPTLVPTFTTFNISRSYSVRVCMAIECGGKTFHLFGEYTTCTLLAKDFDSGLPEYTLPPPNPNTIQDEPPSPYDFIEQPQDPTGPPPSQQQPTSSWTTPERRKGSRGDSLCELYGCSCFKYGRH